MRSRPTRRRRWRGFGGLARRGDVGADLDAPAVAGERLALRIGLLAAVLFLALRHLQGDLLQASSVGAEFQPALAGVQYYLPAFLQLQQPGAERHQARQALATGEDGHVGGGAAFGHAQASRAGIHQRREVGG